VLTSEPILVLMLVVCIVEVLTGEGDVLHGRGAASIGGLVKHLVHLLPFLLVLGQRVRPTHWCRRWPPRHHEVMERCAREGLAHEASNEVLHQAVLWLALAPMPGFVGERCPDPTVRITSQYVPMATSVHQSSLDPSKHAIETKNPSIPLR
jgi:hypothetical protein